VAGAGSPANEEAVAHGMAGARCRVARGQGVASRRANFHRRTGVGHSLVARGDHDVAGMAWPRSRGNEARGMGAAWRRGNRRKRRGGGRGFTGGAGVPGQKGVGVPRRLPGGKGVSGQRDHRGRVCAGWRACAERKGRAAVGLPDKRERGGLPAGVGWRVKIFPDERLLRRVT